ncbi:LysR family transcriptional regulator [uncultured Sphingomonas sp.]|uniref:LysR family transcriptional regulator n=1 Tax=uncultured Sphingomonas sp. TaxID=158754 RepID=UPI0025E1C2EF|nr:LysR family transcriptional regulator [uncultured Sphingomonas sp.]
MSLLLPSAMAMNFELLDIRVFVAIADGKSFLRAAEQLNLSQPAISRRVQKLEATVGTPLLERTTRTVRLTPAGKEILPLLRRLMEELDESLLGMMASGERQAGRLTIASIPSATVRFLPDVLEALGRDYRNVRVRVLDLSATECAEAVRTGQAEFAITLPVSSDGDMVYEPLTDDPYGLVCRKDDPLADLADPAWSDLAGLRLVTVHPGSGNRTALDAGLARAGIELRWFYEVTRLTSALALVQAGLGPSVLPRLACEGPDARDLVWRPLRGAEVTRTIGVLRRSSAKLSPAASRLMGLLTEAWTAEPRPAPARDE